MKSIYLSIFLIFLISSQSDAIFNALIINKTADQIITQIPVPFNEKIISICEGFEASLSDEKWESVIEENNLIILFQCTNNSQLNDPWKIRLLSNYIRSFERNRPKKWFQEEQTNNFTCKDSYGRYIPMPLGVQRCFIQHHSIIDQQNNITFNQTQESGTFATPIFNVISEYSCADSFSWKPYSPPSTTSSSMASKILNDQECAVKVSLTTMHFFCCCYLNGNLCGEVGRLTGQGLTCPQLSMDATLTFDERTWEYTETENVEERISAENLVLQHQCHMRISLRRPKRDPIIHTSLSLVKNDDDICGLMFTKQFLINHECVHFERQCYTDVDDELIYCCRFEDSKERSGSEDKILSIHSIYAKYVSDGFEEHLTPYKRCLRPFSRNNNLTQYCVYFYDKIMNRFVNIQIDENYRISNSVNQKIQNFLNDDSQDLIYIEGELNKKDKRVTQCDEAESLSNLPFWYRPTVAMFKCFTNVNDTERCDDFVQNGTIIEEVKKRVEDQYLCYTSDSTEPQPSWDMYCFENLIANPNNNSDYSVTKTIGNRTTNYTRSRDWSGDFSFKSSGVQEIGIYWCADNEKYVSKKGYSERVCACASYKTSKTNRISTKSCNDGNFVKNMHLIETSPIFVQEDQASKCVIPSITEDDERRKCVDTPEKGSTQSCVIGMLKDHSPDIGCVREPNLSHGRENHRMEHHEWHDYLICKEIFNPDEEPYRCVLRDNSSKKYAKYGIICCCRSEACGDAYKEAAKFRPRKTFDIFVHQTS